MHSPDIHLLLPRLQDAPFSELSSTIQLGNHKLLPQVTPDRGKQLMAHDEKTSSRLLEPLKGAAEAESIQENRTDPSSMKKIEL